LTLARSCLAITAFNPAFLRERRLNLGGNISAKSTGDLVNLFSHI
jgi:hypothetical protein